MSKLKVWNSLEHTAEQALDLPEGSYAANLGFWVQQSVSPDDTLEAAQAIIDASLDITVSSQAKLIVTAENQGLAFDTWAPTTTI